MELVVTEMELEVVLDSGSVAHVANPSHLPANALVIPNENGRHFQGANEFHIENYGTCRTRLQDQKIHVVADCGWSVAEVAQLLHAAHRHRRGAQTRRSLHGRQSSGRATRHRREPAKERTAPYAVRPQRGRLRS